MNNSNLRYQSMLWLIGVWMVGFSAGVLAQAPSRAITLQDLKLQANVLDSVRGISGMRLTYTFAMNWLAPEGEERRFAMSYRIEHAGEPVFYSSEIQFPDYQFFATPSPEANPVGMQKRLTSFIPYKYLSLLNGPQELTWIVSLVTRDTAFLECIQAPMQIDFQKPRRRGVAEQAFRVENVTIRQRVEDLKSGNPGMFILADVYPQFPREEAKDSIYKLFWTVKGVDGSVRYDSRKAPKPQPIFDEIAPPVLAGKSSKFRGFVDYYRLQMDGPGEAVIEVWVDEGQGKSRKIYEGSYLLQIPRKYNFEDQKFLNPRLVARESVEETRRVMLFNFDAQFALVGTQRNHEVGNYYFYLEVHDLAGKPVFAKERAVNSDQKWLDQKVVAKAFDSSSVAGGRFVLPLNLLKLPEGEQSIVVSIRATDSKGLVKFPLLLTDTVRVVKPKEYAFQITVEELVVADHGFDVAFQPFTQGNPDIRYYLYVGDYAYFVSREAPNSLVGAVQTWKCWFLEGDVLAFSIMDLDWGAAPNEDDFIAKYFVDFRDQPHLFYLKKENEGHIVKFRVKFQKI